MARKYGLISEPSISKTLITPNIKYIVIGSDGLFDKIPYEEMAKLMHHKNHEKSK